MLDLLLESRARSERRIGGYASSFVLHSVAIALAIVATQQAQRVHANLGPEEMHLMVPIVKPPPPPAVMPPANPTTPPLAKGFQIVVSSIDIPTVLPPIDLTKPITDERDFTGTGGVAGGFANGDSTVRTRPAGDATYSQFQVEKPAAIVPGSNVVDYPETLRNAGVEGDALVTFVIDTAGRADMRTYKLIRATRPEFADAVKRSLLRTRFLPAEVGGMKVRQQVEMPFSFTIRQ